jgi:hypothetical protein
MFVFACGENIVLFKPFAESRMSHFLNDTKSTEFDKPANLWIYDSRNFFADRLENLIVILRAPKNHA